MKFSVKKISNLLLSASVITLLLTQCKEEEKKVKTLDPVSITGYAQGTTYSIKYVDSLQRNFKPQIDSILLAIDLSLSTYNKQSIISKFNESGECQQIDNHFLDVFFLSDEIYEASDGAFDPTVLPLMKIWGFGSDTVELDSTLTATPDSLGRDSLITAFKDSLINEWVDNVGFEYLMLEGDLMYNKFEEANEEDLQDNFICKDDSLIQITFDAIAQGYSADVIGEWLEVNMGIKNYLLEIGGEILAQGLKNDRDPWTIAIEHPHVGQDSTSGIAKVDMLKFRAVAVSGNYRKYKELNGMKIGHNIDPRTGYPSKNKLISVAVFADDCATADAFATAFMIMEIEESVPFVEFNGMQNLEAFFIFENDLGQIETYTTTELESELILPSDSIQPSKYQN